MPSAPDELRDLAETIFGSIDTDGPLTFLRERGYKATRGGEFIAPTPDHKPTWKEEIALDFLFMEWDFGGIVSPDSRKPPPAGDTGKSSEDIERALQTVYGAVWHHDDVRAVDVLRKRIASLEAELAEARTKNETLCQIIKSEAEKDPNYQRERRIRELEAELAAVREQNTKLGRDLMLAAKARVPEDVAGHVEHLRYIARPTADAPLQQAWQERTLAAADALTASAERIKALEAERDRWQADCIETVKAVNRLRAAAEDRNEVDRLRHEAAETLSRQLDEARTRIVVLTDHIIVPSVFDLTQEEYANYLCAVPSVPASDQQETTL